MTEMGTGTNALDKHVAAKISALREEQSLAIEMVTDAIGLSTARYMAYESGRERIPARDLYLLGRQFNVSLQYFFEGMGRDMTDPGAGHLTADGVVT